MLFLGQELILSGHATAKQELLTGTSGCGKQISAPMERERTVTAMAEYIERETFLKDIEERYCLPCKEAGRDHSGCKCRACWVDDMRGDVIDAPAADVKKMSDGYHTFADLYEQRLILSAALAKNNPHAWKSKRHEDGSVPFGGGWFIMGFDTDEGCYTYHYELKDWDLFQCKELDKGRPWDGHTSKDVRRLLSIPAADVAPVVHGQWLDNEDYMFCSICGIQWYYCDNDTETFNYCPNCGAKMNGEAERRNT